MSFIYPIYIHNWRNINTIYIHNKTSNKRNFLTIKKIYLEVGRAKVLSAPWYKVYFFHLFTYRIKRTGPSSFPAQGQIYSHLLVVRYFIRHSPLSHHKHFPTVETSYILTWFSQPKHPAFCPHCAITHCLWFSQ